MSRLCSSLLLSLLIASSASAVTMAWTPIGNPGNPGDTPRTCNGCGGGAVSFGSVPYTYQIGTYEVTNAQYVEFLNAKAASDPLGLYNPNMDFVAAPNDFGGITRTGSSGSYTYSTIPGRESMPVNWVSWYSAVRFANWMNNGQGASDTESGSYTLLGGTPRPNNYVTLTRNPEATIVLTSENEWYKAAYYDPSSSSYFSFPTGSNIVPTCTTPTATPNTSNCGYAINPPYGAETPVGSYPGSSSPYGTFDQAGSVWEWNEGTTNNPQLGGTIRADRGGAFIQAGAASSSSETRGTEIAGNTEAFLGFRLAMVPEPSTGLLVIAGLLGLAGGRRRNGLRFRRLPL